MAGNSLPVSTPNAYSTPEITRAATLLSELNIVNVTNHLNFFNKYGFNPYMYMTHANGGFLKIKSKDTKNKQFYWYEDFGRTMGYFTVGVTANSGGVNTPTTVTATTGSYSANGTRALMVNGGTYYNAQTGVESISSNLNSNTPFGFTMQLTPVVAGQDTSVIAGQELQFRGFKYVGEASTPTEPIVKNISKYINYCSQHRVDDLLTDLSMMEELDLIYNGHRYYLIKQQDDTNNRIIQEIELMCWDSNIITNPAITIDSGTLGLKQFIQQYGINIIYPQFNVLSTLSDLERKLDSEGGPMEYDWMQDTNQNITVNNALATEYPNGAIIYSMDDLRRGFKSYTPNFRKYNFTRYTPITDPRFYGSQAVSLNNNSGFGVPTGKRDLNGDESKNDMPQLIRRYQEINGLMVYTWETGALSRNGKTGTMQLSLSSQQYPGLTVQGANQFFYIKQG